MNDNDVITFINDIFSSDYHYDESLGYQLTSDDFDWLEYVRTKFTPVNPIEITKHGQNHYFCSYCGKSISPYFENDYMKNLSYCDKCGQKIKWNQVRKELNNNVCS